MAILCAIIYFFIYSDTLDIFILIKNINYFYLFLFLLMSFCNRAFNAYRIKPVVLCLFKSSVLSLKTSFRILLFSEFVSVIIPTTYSTEAVRLIKLSKCKLSLKQSSLAIIIDRITGLFVLCFITFMVFLLSDAVLIIYEFINEELVPFSILGVGAGELVLVMVSGYFGVSHEQALAVVMIIILGKYLFSIFGFLLELYCDGIDVVRKNLSTVK